MSKKKNKNREKKCTNYINKNCQIPYLEYYCKNGTGDIKSAGNKKGNIVCSWLNQPYFHLVKKCEGVKYETYSY